MPTNRHFIRRTQRPVFSVEVLELFLALEHRPDAYHTEDSRRLAGLLNLTGERLKACHVNDRSRRSGYPAGHLTDLAFRKVREVRKALLAICAHRARDDEKGVSNIHTPSGEQEPAAAEVEPEAQSSAEPSSAA
jgi:hypothetical protein